MYICEKCGLCCMQVSKSPIYAELDRGDGICYYFNSETKLCSIYNKRPTLCNISKSYEVYFKDQMSKDDYYRLNYESCKKIRNNGGE